MEYGNTAEGDSYTFELDSAGMYIKSGYAAATTIEVGGQVVTDGKATNRIRLKLGEDSSSTTSSTGVENGSTDATGGTTGSE
ncbi:hypothetical protein D3C76_1524650 [compost metagenome]